MNSLMRLCLLVIVAPAVAFAASRNQGPTTKTASPCGVKALPLAVGNQWTYALVPSAIPIDSQIARIAPIAPNTVVVTVKSIQSGPNGNTVITLEEKARTDRSSQAAASVAPADAPDKPLPTSKPQATDERTITTTITCNANKFDLSPDSFWFAAEPGGSVGIQLGAVERPKATSFQLTNGRFGDSQWREDLLVSWTRVPHAGSQAKPASGKLELERRFTPQQPETVQTKLGSYRAEKLGLITTGRITLNHVANKKPTELPAGWLSTLWIAEGAGVVQTLNPFGHMYQLTAITLK